MINNARLYLRLPEALKQASQNTAKAFNMDHSQFVRDAIKEKILLASDAFDEKLGVGS
jgi:antitoxin component of RelBE/YafQ-DinJ toxin-antitoxin module